MSWSLQRETLEVRYQKGYTYIDKTGFIAETVCDRFPDFELEQANVPRTQLLNRKAGADVQYGLNRAAVSADLEFLAHDRYFEYCSFIFPLLFKEVGIRTLTRVGNRIIFHQKFHSLKDAQAFVNAVARFDGGKIPILTGLNDGAFRHRQVNEFMLRLEDEKLGFLVRLQAGTSGVELQGPNVEALQAKLPPPTPVAILDVDIYTTQPMAVEVLIPPEFVKNNLKIVEGQIIPLLKSGDHEDAGRKGH